MSLFFMRRLPLAARATGLLMLSLTLAGCPYVGERTYNDEIRDWDGDGEEAERFGGSDCDDDNAAITVCDVDGDGENSVQAGGTDCDDTDELIGAGAQEICNDIDDDCDGLVDDLDVDVQNIDRATWYRDADGDGFGNPDDTAEACAAPPGFIAVAGDCDDSRSDVSPSANEFCDNVDHNCDDDLTFNAVDMNSYYVDTDGDGFGRDQLAGEQGCPGDAPVGTAANNEDCNDNDATVFPNAVETWYDGVDQDCDEADDYDKDGDGATYPTADCDDEDPNIGPGGAELCDGLDNDCDGSIDEVEDVTPFDLNYYYLDGDGDGAGGGDAIASCDAAIPTGFVRDGGDCDDGNPTVNPGGSEVCDGADNDCNGFVDDNPSNPNTYYVDGDGDGFGDVVVTACVQADGWSGFDGDCNDGDATVFPGAFEICGDANQQDCDLSGPAFDCDGDGIDGAYAGNSNSGTDCDDTQAATYPSALEICDGADNDCDGLIDNPPTEPVDNLIYYADLDGDGFGAGPQLFPLSCGEAVGMVTNDDDCNDLDAAVHPNAGELCDGIDNNCDTLVDQGLIAEPRVFFLDLDGDGAGDPSASYAQSCAAPVDGRTWVDAGTDCNDADPDIVPGADEICDGIDNDCDALVDDQDNDTIGATWYIDTDSDGFGAGAASSACAQPLGYVANDDDCDDSRNDINPGIPEECDGYDNDCDGFIDGADSQVVGNVDWYPDADSDGYGDANATLVEACVAPAQHVANNLDCDDTAAAVSPAALEVCDGQDNDCDTDVDDDDSFVVGGQIWYTDGDQDGIGGSTSVFSCSQPLDAQQVPTAVAITGDCDDANSARFPGNLEVCDGVDGDCDGVADADEPIPPVGSVDAWADGDGDGYGTGPRQEVCLIGARAVLATGLADVDGDCDDVRSDVNPGVVAEVCEGGAGADLDCDGLYGPDDPDYDGTNGFVYGLDADGDSYGNPLYTIDSCSAFQPNGYSSRLNDCDDTDANVYPDMPWYADVDQDGFGDLNSVTNSPTGTCDSPVGDFVVNSDDCNDGDGTIHPYGVELCDGIDNDCDGLTDDEDDVVGEDGKFYVDFDGDGWGDPTTGVSSCTGQPPGTGGPWVTQGYDCDDTDEFRNPQAQETCDDQLDTDCDGGDNTTFDPQTPIQGGTDYYLDGDQDGFFSQNPISSCDVPTASHQLGVGTDCDDEAAQAYPGAVVSVGSSQAQTDLQQFLYSSICDNTTIVLDAEVFDGPIYLNMWQNVTIRGAGVGQTVIRGQSGSSVLESFGSNMSIESMTLLNENGPGPYVQGATGVTFRDVDFGDVANNPSFRSGRGGAALAAYDADITLENVNFYNGIGTFGGRGGCVQMSGSFGSPQLTMTDVVFDGCRAEQGAAIYHDHGNVSATRLTIRNSQTDDPYNGSAGVWYSQAGTTTVTDLDYIDNEGLVWLNNGAVSASFTRTRARNNPRGVFQMYGAVGTWTNLLSIRNGSSGWPALSLVSSSGSVVDQATFIRDNQSIAVADPGVSVNNALFVDVDSTLSELSPGDLTLNNAMSNYADLFSAVQNQTGVTENVAMTFQSYFHDPFGVSLPIDTIDANPTGSWNTGFGAHHGISAGWWDYGINADGDNLPDAWEIWWLGDTSGGDIDDVDADNFSNLQEYTNNTHPFVADTDTDGRQDGDDFAPMDPFVQDP